MHKANVSEIHLCQRCPRLLAYQLRGHKNAWKIGLSGSGDVCGGFFHDRIAAPFHKVMATGSKPALLRGFSALLDGPPEKIEAGVLALLERYFFVPAVKRYGSKLRAGQVMGLGRGLDLWSRFMARFLIGAFKGREGTLDSFLAETFHNPEELIEAVYEMDEGEGFLVSGRYDAVLFHASAGEAVIVEFKGRKAGYVDEDFVQIVLYCWLVRAVTGITPRGVAFYLDEAEPEVLYSAENIALAMGNLPVLLRQVTDVQDVVSGVCRKNLAPAPDRELCGSCSFDPRCDRDWGPRLGRRNEKASLPLSSLSTQEASELSKTLPKGALSKPVIEPASLLADEPGCSSEEAEAVQVELVRTFKALKLAVEPQGYIAGPRFIRFKVSLLLDRGVTVKKLTSQAENLQVALSLPSAPLIQPQSGYVSIDVPRKSRIPLTLGEVWRRGQRNRPTSAAAFPIGMSVDGGIVWADLSEPTMTSILVGGTSGSGKSVFLKSAAIGLALNAGPSNMRITLVDPKRVSFTDLAVLPHLAGRVIMDNEPAMERLAELVKEMEQRYRMFERAGVADLNGYNAVADPLCRQVVMIDEYADLIIDKQTREQLELSVQRLGQKGRAAGIHLILATQRPDSKVVTPIIKANLQLKVALKVTTASNSSVILDQTGAEYLTGHGDMIVGGSVPIQRLQGPLVTRTEIEMAIRNK